MMLCQYIILIDLFVDLNIESQNIICDEVGDEEVEDKGKFDEIDNDSNESRSSDNESNYV